MKKASFLQRLRAAHALSIAATDGTAPRSEDLAALGLNENFKQHFKR
ncbi:MAG: hypothetical protein AAF468_18890 [Pseudomonadota bacterium]